MKAEMHPDVAVLAPLLGQWSGPGQGSYPTIESFDYVETLNFAHTGKPFVTYAQYTRDATGVRALHTETGYLRPAGPGHLELVVAQPTGIVEVDEGTIELRDAGTVVIRLHSKVVGLASSAKEVTEVERSYHLQDGLLTTALSMAAVGEPLTHHLSSQLRRPAPISTSDEVTS